MIERNARRDKQKDACAREKKAAKLRLWTEREGEADQRQAGQDDRQLGGTCRGATTLGQPADRAVRRIVSRCQSARGQNQEGCGSRGADAH